MALAMTVTVPLPPQLKLQDERTRHVMSLG